VVPTRNTSPDPAGPAGPAPTVPRHGPAHSLIEGMRPRQWVKNVLVLSAPFAAGGWLDIRVLAHVALALGCFIAASAGTYLVNDVRDADADRAHPVKRHRPVARGDLPVHLALPTGTVLLAASVGAPFALDRHGLGGCLAAYVTLTLAYNLWLKHEPVLDLAVVAAGFVLRSAAGGLAADIPLSAWFLVIASFGSLFMVAGKRYSEIVLTGGADATRRSLAEYSDTYLRFVWSSSAAVILLSYCLWATEVGSGWRSAHGIPWAALSLAPFAVALLRYALQIDRGAAGAPEEVILSDRTLQLLGLGWVAVFSLGLLGV
jgi:decaprenyl-phosphate phosphoribosyltransferase